LAEEWVTVLGLESVKEISFKNLSKAKQRLILIARAMIKHLPLLIVDEALINLDNQKLL
jgi:molybdate transport system ATP-binding protein